MQGWLWFPASSIRNICPAGVANRFGQTTMRRMGIFDKAKDLAGNKDELLDKAKDAVTDHGDKLPGGLGDKAEDALDKAEDLADKIPGQD